VSPDSISPSGIKYALVVGDHAAVAAARQRAAGLDAGVLSGVGDRRVLARLAKVRTSQIDRSE
jgi:hypothetical protein